MHSFLVLACFSLPSLASILFGAMDPFLSLYHICTHISPMGVNNRTHVMFADMTRRWRFL